MHGGYIDARQFSIIVSIFDFKSEIIFDHVKYKSFVK